MSIKQRLLSFLIPLVGFFFYAFPAFASGTFTYNTQSPSVGATSINITANMTISASCNNGASSNNLYNITASTNQSTTCSRTSANVANFAFSTPLACGSVYILGGTSLNSDTFYDGTTYYYILNSGDSEMTTSVCPTPTPTPLPPPMANSIVSASTSSMVSGLGAQGISGIGTAILWGAGLLITAALLMMIVKWFRGLIHI